MYRDREEAVTKIQSIFPLEELPSSFGGKWEGEPPAITAES
jgi:hypothetical protein